MSEIVSDPSGEPSKTPRKPAPRSTRAAVDARVEIIADLMVDGRWLGRRSAKELASRWSVSVNAVHEYASTASTLVRVSIGSPEEILVRICASLDRIATLALHKGKYDAAIKANLGLADVLGLKAPTKSKTELSGPDGGPIQTAGVVVLPPLDPEE